MDVAFLTEEAVVLEEEGRARKEVDRMVVAVALQPAVAVVFGGVAPVVHKPGVAALEGAEVVVFLLEVAAVDKPVVAVVVVALQPEVEADMVAVA